MLILIVGITGSFGRAVAYELLSRKSEVLVNDKLIALVRNEESAKKLFNAEQLEHIVFVKGDSQNKLDYDRAVESAPGKLKFIVHAVNSPYNDWEKLSKPALENSIACAKKNDATVLFPANVYSLKPVYDTPLKEDHPFGPITKMGKIRLLLEELLQNSGSKYLSIRAGDYFGPTLTHPTLDMTFRDPLILGKPITWIGSTKVKHEHIFLPDLARACVDLFLVKDLPDQYTIHFRGLVVEGSVFIEALKKELEKRTGRPAKLTVLQWWMVWFATLHDPVIREYYSLRYLKENNVELDDTRLRSHLPLFKLTTLEETISQTLDAIKK